MKKYLVLGLILIVIAGIGIETSTAEKSTYYRNGFDEYGFNYKARLFNGWLGYYDMEIEGGWLPGTQDSWLVMKWSEDWNPTGDSSIGAWCFNHFTWYSDDYEVTTRFGWLTRAGWNEQTTDPDTRYRIKESAKIMRVSNNQEKWGEYRNEGAYPAGDVYPFLMGNYESGVPKYVVFQDTIEVYDTKTGELVLEYNLCEASSNGLGKPIF